MEKNLPTGQWHGFYLESHQPRRGWMHLYMEFSNEKIAGEGTDYVGPWNARGQYNSTTGMCTWVKQYLGKHQVHYQGLSGPNGIQGQWKIGYLAGEFHIWPTTHGHLDELYLREDLSQTAPSVQLGTVPTADFANLA